MANSSLPGPRVAMVDQGGRVSPEWYRYFVEKERLADAAAEGEVLTGGSSGLEGGGAVSEGVSLSIAPNGVTNAMLRDSLGTSVIGRFQNSTGDPADIQATANGRYLRRMGNMLTFGPLNLESFTVAEATGPIAAGYGAGALIYVTDEAGGAVPAFSDGADFRRVTDRAVIS